MTTDLPDKSSDNNTSESQLPQENAQLNEQSDTKKQQSSNDSELEEYTDTVQSAEQSNNGILVKIRKMTIYDLLINLVLITLVMSALIFYLSSWTIVESPTTDKYYMISGVESVNDLESVASETQIVYIQSDRSYAVGYIESVNSDTVSIVTQAETKTSTQTKQIQTQSIRGVVEYEFERIISIQKLTDYIRTL